MFAGEALASPTKRQRVSSAGAAAAAAAASQLQERIDRNTAELVKLSEEKVQLAHQIYDYVDRHIQKLDKELKAFDAEVDKERARLGLPPAQPQLVAPPSEGGDGRQKKKGAGGRQCGGVQCGAGASRPEVSQLCRAVALAHLHSSWLRKCHQ